MGDTRRGLTRTRTETASRCSWPLGYCSRASVTRRHASRSRAPRVKLAAISRRGLRRDFWDLFEALGTGLTLRECGDAYLQRFGVREADLYHVLRALTYFDDAEKDPIFPRGLDTVKWDAIKAFFRREAPKLVRPP